MYELRPNVSIVPCILQGSRNGGTYAATLYDPTWSVINFHTPIPSRDKLMVAHVYYPKIEFYFSEEDIITPENIFQNSKKNTFWWREHDITVVKLEKIPETHCSYFGFICSKESYHEID
jgi:hypothetical protein